MKKVGLLLLIVVCASASAEEGKKAALPKAGAPQGLVLATPKEGSATSEGSSSVSDRPRRAAPPPPSQQQAMLAGVRARSTADGEARLMIDGAEQTIKPGGAIGGDVVRSISPGRLVLVRRATSDRPGGDGLVIMTFDDQGRPAVRVVWTANPTPVVAPAVR